jgi:two-component system chemotaxis response regulator CheB
MPPIVITQHMPAGFTKSFATRLDTLCACQVQEAAHLQLLQHGNIYLAQGDKHMEIEAQAGKWIIKLRDGETVSSHKPSVDVLFSSVAKAAGKKAVGVILTGMGHDGAEGLLKMREAGAKTIGQNEASCVVYGMPKVAKAMGGVENELHLSKIAVGIIQLCEK